MNDDRTKNQKVFAPAIRHHFTQDDVPDSRLQRDRLFIDVQQYVNSNKLFPPISVDLLGSHAAAILTNTGMDIIYKNYAMVLVSNQIWRQSVAATPYNKRLLLLPKCLRDHENCPAKFDELGLICRHCGKCPIHELQGIAERLGYAVLVAEGSPVVISLIETGKVEAIIGASCLSVLEQAFPHMEAGAVPGLAIPLLHDGCKNTAIDIDQVLDAIYDIASDTKTLDLQQLRNQVNSYFTRDALVKLFGKPTHHVEEIAIDWITRAGKRWRPFLAAGVFRAIADDNKDSDSDLQKCAVAVECFHKASLIHDDIEDDDDLRYGQNTLHADHGVAIAINVGDFLLGQGYHLLTSCDTTAQRKADMLAVAAAAHKNLCIGQGQELAWVRQKAPLTSVEVMDIFSRKTSPAFEVALRIGMILAGGDDLLAQALKDYSDALGRAYQIRDDIEDFNSSRKSNDFKHLRPSLLLALAYEKATGKDKDIIEAFWKRSAPDTKDSRQLHRIVTKYAIPDLAADMTDACRLKAIAALTSIENRNLNSLLRKVLWKIFNNLEVMGSCDEHKTEHD